MFIMELKAVHTAIPKGYDSSVTNVVIQGINGDQTYYFAVNAVDQFG